MKVLHLVDSLTLGGAETLLATLARVAPTAGFTMEVAALGGRSDGRDVLHSALTRAGARPVFLDVRRLAAPSAVPLVARAIRASGCDVVHAHLEYSAVLGNLAGRLLRRPVVSTFHHVAAPLQGRPAAIERLAVELAGRGARTIFVSDASRASFASRYGERATWTTIRNGVDLSGYDVSRAALPSDLGVNDPPTGISPAGSPAPAPDSAAAATAGPVLALVAALRPGKGHERLLRLWPTIRAAVPGARLLLVGAGTEEPRLRSLAAGTRLEQQGLVFAGLRQDVPTLLRGVDVVVLPSESEALPTTLVEAAAAGRPAVATDVGGVREVVVDGETGVLVPAADDDALVDALVDLLRDANRRRGMGASARSRAEAEFDASRWAARLAQVYRDAQQASPRTVPALRADLRPPDSSSRTHP